MRTIVTLVVLIFSFSFFSVGHMSEVNADNRFVSGTFTNKAGSREYKLYVPSTYKGQRVPLIVMLHGCGQDPDDFSLGTKMNELAERDGFLTLYPAQNIEANTSRCWNWFEPDHQMRGEGEPSIIAGMTQMIIDSYNIHPNKVYLAGMSAGGAMTTLVGAAYPDVFASIGVSAGLEYKAATNLLSGLVVMQMGGPPPKQQGGLAFLAMGEHAKVVPVILFHGDEDVTVNVLNGHQTITQWAYTNDYADDGLINNSIMKDSPKLANGKVDGGYSYEKYLYQTIKGKPVMEKWIINGMGHKWSGGSIAGSHTDPKGPDASEEMIRFFFENPKNKY